VTLDANAAGGTPRFTVGGVISAGLSVVFANLFRFLAIILAAGVPLILLLGIGVAVLWAGAISSGPGFNVTLAGDATAAQVLFFILGVFLFLLAYFLIQSALTYGTLQHLRGRPVAIGACFSHGFNALPRVLLACILLFVGLIAVGGVAALLFGLLLGGFGLAGILIGLAFGAGFLYIITLYWLFVPAIVVERAGVLECFGRSIALTKGHRWGIFGILVLITIANWVISFASQALTQVAPAAGGVIDIASGLFFLALGPVLAAVGYYFLRAEKEGVAIDDVVRVFE
jgi:hypothetical protein